MASEESRAALSRTRGEVAAGMSNQEAKKKFIARQGEEETKGKQDLSGLSEDAFRQRNINVAGSFKKGGKVPKTGIYKLHKGETVTPKGKMIAHGANKNMIHPGSSANHKRYSFGKE